MEIESNTLVIAEYVGIVTHVWSSDNTYRLMTINAIPVVAYGNKVKRAYYDECLDLRVARAAIDRENHVPEWRVKQINDRYNDLKSLGLTGGVLEPSYPILTGNGRHEMKFNAGDVVRVKVKGFIKHLQIFKSVCCIVDKHSNETWTPLSAIEKIGD